MPTFSIAANNKNLGTYIVKKNVISLGRSRNNTISIASKGISRNHLRIELTSEGWTVTDLGSLNGTYVNDIRISNSMLSEGDKVTIGVYTITFSPEPLGSETLSQESDLSSDQENAIDVRLDDNPAPDAAFTPQDHASLTQNMPTLSAAEKNQQIEAHLALSNMQEASIQDSHIETVEEKPEVDDESHYNAELPHIEQASAESTNTNDPDAMTFEEKIKRIIGENPLAKDAQIRERLASGEYGETKISRQELQAVLKEMNLETTIKRYNFFLHS